MTSTQLISFPQDYLMHGTTDNTCLCTRTQHTASPCKITVCENTKETATTSVQNLCPSPISKIFSATIWDPSVSSNDPFTHSSTLFKETCLSDTKKYNHKFKIVSSSTLQGYDRTSSEFTITTRVDRSTNSHHVTVGIRSALVVTPLVALTVIQSLAAGRWSSPVVANSTTTKSARIRKWQRQHVTIKPTALRCETKFQSFGSCL